MNDLERDLRELLETKADGADVAPRLAPELLKRARRRQVGTVLTAILGTAAVVVASIAGLRTLTATDTPDTLPAEPPVLPDGPAGFRSVALPFASIAYPEDWYLLDLAPGANAQRILQLTNFDPGLRRLDCEAGDRLPPGGALFEMQLGAMMDPMPEWPTSLGVVPGPGGACGADGILAASWTVGGESAFSAAGLLAPDALAGDRDAIVAVFDSMVFSDGGRRQTEELFGTSNLILDSAVTPAGPAALYAYRNDLEGGSAWIGIAGHGLSGAGEVGRQPPASDDAVTGIFYEWGGVVWGNVSSIVERAELRTVEGGTYPATLLPMPASLGVEGQQIVWGVIDAATADRVTTMLYDGQGNVLNTFYPTGPRVVIGTGTDPEGGAWELYLEPTDQGTGLGFSFVTGSGGSGCCLSPLAGDFRLDGSGSGSGGPSHITALASEVVARVVFETADGGRIDGQVFPVPDESLGIAQVALVLVPEDVALEGHLVAYDGDGNELGRELVTMDFSEPAGPTPEIDAVWQSLRASRDAAARYLERHGTFDMLTLDALIELAPPGSVTFATRPEPQTVSVFVIDEFHLVVSSSAITGEAYCIAVEAEGPEGGFGYRYGAVFTESYDECRGGWPELGG